MTELRSFTRQHLEGAPAFFAAEDCQTYTTDPERTYRALAAPGSTTLVAVDQGEGFTDAPATHGLRGNDRAATDGGL